MTLMTTDMGGWAEGTLHFQVGGHDYAIEATATAGMNMIPANAEPLIGELLNVIGDGQAPLYAVVRPTVVFECTPEGNPISLTPLHTFPPGTSHEDALAGLT